MRNTIIICLLLTSCSFIKEKYPPTEVKISQIDTNISEKISEIKEAISSLKKNQTDVECSQPKLYIQDICVNGVIYYATTIHCKDKPKTMTGLSVRFNSDGTLVACDFLDDNIKTIGSGKVELHL